MRDHFHDKQQREWRGARGPQRDDRYNGTGITRTVILRLVQSLGVVLYRTLTTALDALGAPVHGAILFRGASSWQFLDPSTPGKVLTTQDAGADPTWSAAAGGSLTVRANGVDIGTRPNINFLGASILAAEDIPNDEVEVTVYAYVEPRTSDPGSPVNGQMWLRTDL